MKKGERKEKLDRRGREKNGRIVERGWKMSCEGEGK